MEEIDHLINSELLEEDLPEVQVLPNHVTPSVPEVYYQRCKPDYVGPVQSQEDELYVVGRSARVEQAKAAAREEGIKFDQDKPRWSLLPVGPLREVLGVLEAGARKYAPGNWMKVENGEERYREALGRHFFDWWAGYETDPETGRSHVAHMICCGLFYLWFRGAK